MSNNNNWKRKLQAILDKHNWRHATRNKGVSHNTENARAQALFRWIGLLHDAGFKPPPEGVRGKHIIWLMRYWTADPTVASRCQEKGVPMLDHPYSAAYIQQQLSFLRVFAGWINKPGMVLPALRYSREASLVKRTYTAQTDKSWAGNGIDALRMIEAVASIDEYVAAQLGVQLAFGLRRKEAIMFLPHAAIVPSHALPASHAVGERYAAFLRIKKGTKGGRLRFTAIHTALQHQALERAKRLAPYPTSHLGHPGKTLYQSLKRFENVVRKAGITRENIGVTPHGLRHQFAGDLFFNLTEVPAPVRGGDPLLDADVLRAAYLEVARQLGHNRPQISNAYLGTPSGRGTDHPSLPDRGIA